MRIIVAGSREFNNYTVLKHNIINVLLILSPSRKPNAEFVSGTARGADQLGERFAKEYEYPVKRFPTDWDKYGKSAGYRRNEQMALYAKEDYGVLIAFWNGVSKGTKHMIDIANRYGLKVFIIEI
jgi:hypothetical protein